MNFLFWRRWQINNYIIRIIMYQQHINHPVTKLLQPLDKAVYNSMYQLFEHICSFWDNLSNPEEYQSRLFVFMENRMRLRPEYREYYYLAKVVIDELIIRYGEEEAYEFLFTDKQANQKPPESSLAVVRQKVSNEFVTFQVAQGGFKVFGPQNSLGYIGGAYIPGEPAPYRTAEA